jgi:hypothetical protein
MLGRVWMYSTPPGGLMCTLHVLTGPDHACHNPKDWSKVGGFIESRRIME